MNMGYESKIIVVDRHEHELPSGEKWIYGDEIAIFDLSKMGYERVAEKTFSEIFKTPIDFNLYIQPEDPNKTYPDEYWREDCYGEHCKYTTVERVIFWLENSRTAKEYRRAKLLLSFLYSLKDAQKDFSNICVVHYGY